MNDSFAPEHVVHELEVSPRKRSLIHFVPLWPEPTGPESLDQARQVQLLTRSGQSPDRDVLPDFHPVEGRILG
jgi:hypothetical protein